MDEKYIQDLYDQLGGEKKFGKFDDFKYLISTDQKYRKDFYDSFGENTLGAYNDFDDLVKKKESTPVPAPSLAEPTAFPSQPTVSSEIPTVQLTEEEVGVDPITEAKRYNELKAMVVAPSEKELLSTRGMAQPKPNIEKIKEAENLRTKFKKEKDIDLEELYQETKDLTPNDYGREGFSKTELLKDRQENYPLYERKIARLKWQSKLENILSNSLINQNIDKDTYDNLNNSIAAALKNSSVGDYQQQRDNIRTVSNIIKNYAGAESKDLLSKFATEVAKVYGNSYQNNFEKVYADSPESKYLDKTAALGYQFLKDVSPEAASQYERLFIDPSKIKDDAEAKSGYDHLMLNLKETGLSLQRQAVKEELNNLISASQKTEGLTPEQFERADTLEKKLTELNAQENELEAEYPEKKIDKVEDAVTEILGGRLGYFSYALGRGGQAIKNTFKGIWEAASSPFMSEEDNTARELAIMGESLGEEQTYKRPDIEKQFVTDKLVIDPSIQSGIDAIVNDKTLEGDQKRLKLYEYLSQHSDKFGRVPVHGGKVNINPSSILYGVTDLATQLLPFIGIEAATGGIGGASTLAKFSRTLAAGFATTFHDNYAAAIREGKSKTDAYRTAFANAAIDGAVMAGAGTAEKVREFYKGSKKTAEKILEKVSDEYIQSVIDKGLPQGLKAIKKQIVERAKAIPSQFAKGVKGGAEFEALANVGAEVKTAFNDTPTDRLQRVKQSVLSILNFGGLSAILGQAGYKKINDLDKGNLLEIGKDPEAFSIANKQLLKDGTFTQAQYEERQALIDRAGEAYKKIPESIAGVKKLSEKEKAEYLLNSIAKLENSKAKGSLPPKQAAEAEVKELVADYKNEILLDNTKDKDLEKRVVQIQKELEPKKDKEGKVVEIPEQDKKKLQAELQAINETIEQRKKDAELESKPTTVSEEVAGNVPAETEVPKEQPTETGVQPSAEPVGEGAAERAAPVLDIYNLTGDELGELQVKAKEADRKRLIDAMGEEWYNKYQMASREEKSKMEDALTDEQRKVFNGEGISDYENPELIKELRAKISGIESADNAKEIGGQIANAISDVANERNKEQSRAIMSAGLRRAEELGLSKEDIQKEAINSLRERMGDENAASIVNEYFKSSQEQTPLGIKEIQQPTAIPEQGQKEPSNNGKPPIKNSFLYEGSKKERQRGVLEHLMSSENIPEFYKEGLKERGLEYKVANMSEAASIAKDIIKDLGINDALEAARTEMVHPSVGSAIFGEALNQIYLKERELRSKGDIDAANEMAKEWADVSNEYAELSTGKGQFNSQTAHFYKSSPMGIVLKKKKENLAKFEEWFKDKEKSFKETFEELIKTEEGQKLLKEEIEKSRKNERKEARIIKRQKVHKAIDDTMTKWAKKLSADLPSGTEKQGVGDIEKIFKSAGGLIKAAYDAGEKIEEVIQKAIDFINDKIGNDKWGVQEFKQEWESKLSEKEIDLEQRYKKRIDELERRIREKDFSAESYKEKPTISEKEAAAREELKKVKEQYNEEKKKSPEYLDKKAKQFIENFRDKLKGLNEKQKEELIRKSVKKLIDNGALNYEDFKKIIADVIGIKDFTDEQVKRIEQLTTDINNAVEVEQKMIQDPTEKNISEFEKAQEANLKAQLELYNLTNTKADVIQTLKSIYTGGLLGIPTLIKNVGQNIIAQLTLRFPKAVVSNLLELGAYGIAKLKSQWIGGEPPALPTRNIFTAQKGYFRELSRGTKHAAFDFSKGVLRKDYFASKEFQSQLSPKQAVKDLKLWKQGELNLTKTEVVDRVLRSTLGWQSDFILRGMGFGDTPQRYAAQGAKALQVAINELNLKDSLEIEAFLRSPRKYAEKVFLRQGKTAKEAYKLAEEVENSIIKEGEKAVFQEDNWLSKSSEWIEKSLKVQKGDSPTNAAAKSAASLLKTKIFPFIKIPANVYWSYFKAANPYFTLALSTKDAILAKKYTKEGDFARARQYQEKSIDNMSHAIVGLGLLAVAKSLINSGYVRTSNTKEDSLKETEGERLFGKQNQVNLGKILGGDDYWVDLSWLGAMGTILDTQARIAENEKKNKQNGLPEKDWFEKEVDNMQYSAAASLNTLVFDQAGKAMDALTGGSKGLKQYFTESILNVENMVTGATLPAISKAMMPTEVRIKGDDILETINNDLKYRNGIYRLFAGYPPSRISIWGEPIKKDNSVSGVLGNMLGFEKGKDESVFGTILYDDYNRTGDTRFFPPPVRNTITVNGKKVELTQKQADDLKILVGQARKQLVEPFVYNMANSTDVSSRYSSLTDEQKVKILNKIYNNGKKIGYNQFTEMYPQFKEMDMPENKEE